MPRGRPHTYRFTIREFNNTKLPEGCGEYRIAYSVPDEEKRKCINIRFGKRTTKEEAYERIKARQQELIKKYITDI